MTKTLLKAVAIFLVSGLLTGAAFAAFLVLAVLVFSLVFLEWQGFSWDDVRYLFVLGTFTGFFIGAIFAVASLLPD